MNYNQRMKKSVAAIALLSAVFVSGCGFFDRVGDHMPVIGERCENWQCFTSSGQEKSREKEAEQMKARQLPSAPASFPPPPGGSGANSAIPPQTMPIAPAVNGTPPLPSELPPPLELPPADK